MAANMRLNVGLFILAAVSLQDLQPAVSVVLAMIGQMEAA